MIRRYIAIPIRTQALALAWPQEAHTTGGHVRDRHASAHEDAAAGAYSPDLNPIEQQFANLKALLRKAAARTSDELQDVIGSLLGAFTPAECRNYLENAGYAFT